MPLFNLHSFNTFSHPQLNILCNGWTNAYQGNSEHLCIFKSNQVIVCSSCTTLTELKHIIFPSPFLQHIKGLLKKTKRTSWLPFKADSSVCLCPLEQHQVHKLMWTVLLQSRLQSIPSTNVLIRELSNPSPIISIPWSPPPLNTSTLLPLTSWEAFLWIHTDTGIRTALTGTSAQCLQVPFHWGNNVGILTVWNTTSFRRIPSAEPPCRQNCSYTLALQHCTPNQKP